MPCPPNDLGAFKPLLLLQLFALAPGVSLTRPKHVIPPALRNEGSAVEGSAFSFSALRRCLNPKFEISSLLPILPRPKSAVGATRS